jgi:hypothetical protein
MVITVSYWKHDPSWGVSKGGRERERALTGLETMAGVWFRCSCDLWWLHERRVSGLRRDEQPTAVVREATCEQVHW